MGTALPGLACLGLVLGPLLVLCGTFVAKQFCSLSIEHHQYICPAGGPCTPLWGTKCPIVHGNTRTWDNFMGLKYMTMFPPPALPRLDAGLSMAVQSGRWGNETVALFLGAGSMGECPYWHNVSKMTRTILVEANPESNAMLEERGAELGYSMRRVQIANTLLCGDYHYSVDNDDRPENVTFYKVPEIPWISSTQTHILANFGFDPQGPRVVRESMRCPSPRQFVREIGLKPWDIAYFMIDFTDWEDVLYGFLGLEGFAPAVLVFEWIVEDAINGRLLNKLNFLAAKGYTLHQHGFYMFGTLEGFF